MRSFERRTQPGLNSPTSLLVAVLLVFSVAWLAVWFAHAQGYSDERAFVDLVFARSISAGQGFRFSGQLTYGTTSPLWVWFLAAVHVVIPDWISAAKVAAVLASVALLGGVYQFARNLMDGADDRDRQSFAGAMVCLIAVNPVFDRWGFSGVPDVAAAALSCWALALASGPLARPIAPWRLLAACTCAGVAPLLRTDMLLFTVLLGAVLFVRWVNLPASFGRKLQVFFAGVALAGAPFLAWSLYALHAFGTVVPNGYAASVAAPNESSLGDLLRIYALGFPVVLIALVAAIAWFGTKLNARSAQRRPLAAGSRCSWLGGARLERGDVPLPRGASRACADEIRPGVCAWAYGCAVCVRVEAMAAHVRCWTGGRGCARSGDKLWAGVAARQRRGESDQRLRGSGRVRQRFACQRGGWDETSGRDRVSLQPPSGRHERPDAPRGFAVRLGCDRQSAGVVGACAGCAVPRARPFS